SQSLQLRLTNPVVNNNRVTYDLSVLNFDEILILQCPITYDSNQLRFNRTKNWNLSGLLAANFSVNTPGTILFSWSDSFLQGVTVPDSTIIVRIEFDIKTNTFNSVCFDVTAGDVEIANTEVTLDSFFIQDDCHDTLFLVDMTTAINEVIPEQYGMRISSLLHSEQIEFSLEAQQSIKFTMYGLHGRLVKDFPQVEYMEGRHSLDIGIDPIPGVYILMTEIKTKRFATKIICQ
ncbi:MAG: hypothetical protein KA166_02685, partial [Saprospiraceae bacterium]|nr:hypothetical protein [Saprospiraceae bacterium]MBP8086643.1 hypothetical protein [Saprospiraceae bacterium]